jgi:SAM-dependent methyltransferase
MVSSLRERIRRSELETLRHLLPESARLLELGGGNGYQASILHEWRHEVTSVDVEVTNESLYYPVQPYDGHTLPFPAETFDVVFSSNVLEHVEDVPRLLAEASRVLRPSGMQIHVLPSSTWRLWTSVAHYVWFVLSVCLGRRNSEGPSPRPRRPYSARNLLRFAGRVAIPQPHGVYSNAITELYCYSAARWQRVFRRSGFLIQSVGPAGVFYSGYKVLGDHLDVPARQRLARILGSSCNVFVLRRPPGSAQEQISAREPASRASDLDSSGGSAGTRSR